MHIMSFKPRDTLLTPTLLALMVIMVVSTSCNDSPPKPSASTPPDHHIPEQPPQADTSPTTPTIAPPNNSSSSPQSRTYTRSFNPPKTKLQIPAVADPRGAFNCEYSATVLNDAFKSHYQASIGQYDAEKLADRAMFKLVEYIDPNKIFLNLAEVNTLIDHYDSSLYKQLIEQQTCDHLIALKNRLATAITTRSNQLTQAVVQSILHNSDADKTQNTENFEVKLNTQTLSQEQTKRQQKYLNHLMTQFPMLPTQPFIFRQLIEDNHHHIINMQMHDFLFWFTAAHTAALDPNSNMLDLDETKHYLGHYLRFDENDVSLGIQFTRQLNGHFTINQIMPASSAEHNGQLQVGDAIYEVSTDNQNWLPTTKLTLAEFQEITIGPAHETVYLRVMRLNKNTHQHFKSLRIAVKRLPLDSADQPSLSQPATLPHTIYPTPSTDGSATIKVGYVILNAPKFSSLNEHSIITQLMANTLSQLLQANVDALLLDLRDHSGGELTSHLDLINLFARPKVALIKSTVNQTATDPSYSHQPLVSDRSFAGLDKALEIPLVIMVSAKTASIAEALTGSLATHGRALVIGSYSTFGKGNIQTIRTLTAPYTPFAEENPTAEITGIKTGMQILTSGMYFLPDGSSVQKKGIQPDIQILSYSFLFFAAPPDHTSRINDLAHSTLSVNNPQLLDLGFRDQTLQDKLRASYKNYIARYSLRPLVEFKFDTATLTKYHNQLKNTRLKFISHQSQLGSSIATQLLNQDQELVDSLFITAQYYIACRHGVDSPLSSNTFAESYPHHLGCKNSQRVLASSPPTTP